MAETQGSGDYLAGQNQTSKGFGGGTGIPKAPIPRPTRNPDTGGTALRPPIGNASPIFSPPSATQQQSPFYQSSGGSTGGGGGGGMPPSTTGGTPGQTTTAGGADLDEIEAIKKKYPNLAYYVLHPELGPILLDAYRENWDATQLQFAITNTTWWRERSASARQWESLRLQDPGEADRMARKKQADIVLLAAQNGITLTGDQTWDLAQQSLQWGWSDNELRISLAQQARTSTSMSGNLAATSSQIKALARNYLVKLNDADARDWAIRIFEGSQTIDGAEAWLRTQSKQRFGWMAGDIDAGTTPELYFRPLKNIVADTLEMNPEDIDLMDPKWGTLTQFVDGNGYQRGMTYTEAAKWARQQPEYRKTRTANQRAASITASLAEIMGAR
jgi:hypothetical protein